ncbi:Response regulator receiver domain protein [Polystyrenella longa]|uniref:Response regulator receiver domain protein n=1 Tax=Polystyrenella longa TaxID=2528007 RepID=A0A518CN58_9PLAN|nr:response regulator [Polystyrenella longa]QDU80666.1 Response regulator receiver domain protein [Polystyrenella longa]
MKRILDIGQCNYDHSNITRFLESHWEVEVDRTHGWTDTERLLSANKYDLILVNRLMDQDHTEGQAIIESLKSHEQYSNMPVMMISNYADAQEEAVKAGAVPGFGKSALNSSEAQNLVDAIIG